jgi:hypothetical protein
MAVTNINVSPMEVTWGASAIGFTDGDMEFTLEDQAVDVTAHQEGTNVLSAIRTGKNASIAMTIKETSVAMVQYLLGQSGSVETASGASAEVVAWGGAKDFTHVLSQASALILHPVKNDANNRAEDITAWLAYPMVETMTFSGENPNTIQVTFRIFPDMSKASEFRLFVFGDSSDGDFSQVT